MKHVKHVFKATSMWEATREKEYSAFSVGAEYGALHWKANFNRLLKVYKEMKNENRRLKQALEDRDIKP